MFKRKSQDVVKFCMGFVPGVQNEWTETLEIPMHFKKGNFKMAFTQVGDVAKIIFNGVLFIFVPAGVAISTVLLKKYPSLRPTSFQNNEYKIIISGMDFPGGIGVSFKEEYIIQSSSLKNAIEEAKITFKKEFDMPYSGIEIKKQGECYVS